MSMSIQGSQSSPNCSKSIGAGSVLGLVGMNAYFLPVTRDRFVRTAFSINKEMTEDKMDMLNESAIQIANKKLHPENKIFLSQLGVPEDIDEINKKCVELKNSITDSSIVKSLKQSFEDNFKVYKKSEASMDIVASKAFSRIRWTNFTWGAVIGFILGSVLGSVGSTPKVPPQM